MQTCFTGIDEQIDRSLNNILQAGSSVTINTTLSGSLLFPVAVDNALQSVVRLEDIITNITNAPSSDNCVTIQETLKSAFKKDVQAIGSILRDITQNSATAVNTALSDTESYGLQYVGAFTLNISPKLQLPLPILTVQYVRSSGSLGECGRFNKAYEIMKGEEAHRLYAYSNVLALTLGFFFKVQFGGFGFAQTIDKKKFALQVPVTFQPFDDYYIDKVFSVRIDVLINNRGLFAYTECQFFWIFYVQLDAGIIFGDDDWYHLTLYLKGRFVGSSEKDISSEHKRDIDKGDNFSQTLVGFIQELLEKLANIANERIEDAKKLVTNAQENLLKVEDWLENKKELVRQVQRKFDDAIQYLEEKKKDLDKAKSVFQNAKDRLQREKEKVDRLCKIKTCSRICVPGIKCRWFSCSFTSCMFSIDDPICVVKNILCEAVRAAVFALYDAAMLALNAPLLALDVAKGVVWMAQITADGLSASLELVNTAVDIAKLGVRTASEGLEIAKTALDAVKVLVKVGLSILNFIIEHGLGSIIDVRNCRFELQMEKKIIPVFAVSCEIKPFSTQWVTIAMRINFLNPIQSLWYAAKSLVDRILDSIEILGRKKRDLSTDYMSHKHPFIRTIRNVNRTVSDLNTIVDDLAKTLNNSKIEIELNKSANGNEDYQQRSEIYSRKCRAFSVIMSFLSEAFLHLMTVNSDFRNAITEIDDVKENISQFNLDMFKNLTLDSASINLTVANEEFNVSSGYVEHAFSEMVSTFYNNSYILGMLALAEDATAEMNQQKQRLKNFDFLTEWSVTLNGSFSKYFTLDECTGLFDCIHYSFFTLNTLFMSEVEMPEYNTTVEEIDMLETEFLQLLNDNESDIYTISTSATRMTLLVDNLTRRCKFCDSPPVIIRNLENVTAVYGKSISLHCEATGTNSVYQWVKNVSTLVGEAASELKLSALNDADAVEYTCVVTNFIATVSTGPALLTLLGMYQQCVQIQGIRKERSHFHNFRFFVLFIVRAFASKL